MRSNLLILFAVLSFLLLSCEPKDEWINQYDSKANAGDIAKICKQVSVECGKTKINYSGVDFEINCGECSNGYECRYNTCWDINECENPDLNNCPEHSTCANEEGSYSCICDDNYTWIDSECVENPQEEPDTDDSGDSTPDNTSDSTDDSDSAPDNGDSTPDDDADTADFTDDSDDSEPDDTDTDDSDSAPDNSDSTPDDDTDTSDSTDDSDDSEPDDTDTTDDGDSSAPDEDDNEPDEEPTTRTATCSGLPANASWNNGSSITQTFDGNDWYPPATGFYSETAVANECGFKCNQGYNWNGEECASGGSSTLPECSASTTSFPCKDSTSGLIWSARASSSYTWSNAKNYCSNLTEGGYSDWHLPTIDELMTILIAERVKNNCQVSAANSCLSSSCWSCSTCTQTGTQQSSSGTSCSSWGTSYSDGRYSKLGDGAVYLWSSSAKSGYTDDAWFVDFGRGYVYYNFKTNDYYVRCVRSEQINDPCNPNPCNGLANSTQICTQHNAFEYSCGCNNGYFWNGQKCAVLPECSETSGTPCKDSISGLTWSPLASNDMTQTNALNYCNNLFLYGFNDWHLPTIDELRTLIKNCPGTETNGACAISEKNGKLSESDSSSSCSCTHMNNNGGYYSKIGDDDTVSPWSSSSRSDDTERAWYVGFFAGKINNSEKSVLSDVRCVR